MKRCQPIFSLDPGGYMVMQRLARCCEAAVVKWCGVADVPL